MELDVAFRLFFDTCSVDRLARSEASCVVYRQGG